MSAERRGVRGPIALDDQASQRSVATGSAQVASA